LSKRIISISVMILATLVIIIFNNRTESDWEESCIKFLTSTDVAEELSVDYDYMHLMDLDFDVIPEIVFVENALWPSAAVYAFTDNDYELVGYYSPWSYRLWVDEVEEQLTWISITAKSMTGEEEFSVDIRKLNTFKEVILYSGILSDEDKIEEIKNRVHTDFKPIKTTLDYISVNSTLEEILNLISSYKDEN